MLILLGFAFLAGIVTILSPCILPILPIILGTAVSGKLKPWGIIAGFILSFTIFTLSLTLIIRLTGLPADSLRTLAVIVIFGFGLILTVPSLSQWWERWTSNLVKLNPGSTQNNSYWGGVIIGASLGLIWAPCVGPIVAAVIALAATSTITVTTILITLGYALGAAIPMLLILLGGKWLTKTLPAIKRHSSQIQKWFGIIMMLTAIVIALGWDRKFQLYIIDKFPKYGSGLTQIEDNGLVRDQLQNLDHTQPSVFGQPNALDFSGGTNWLNSPPLMAQSLKGKVVLVDFWTYTCINCLRTLPYVKAWNEKYNQDGLVIIGVHTPEFTFEHETKNVQQAIRDLGITYPVVQDNNYRIWNGYSNQYWPAKYLIDKDGNIRYTHFGEGNYDETETKIRELLAENGAQLSPMGEITSAPANQAQTPETYLGFNRMDNSQFDQPVKKNQVAAYTLPTNLDVNQWGLAGNWQIGGEKISSQNNSALELEFDAKQVNLVMTPTEGNSKVIVILDGQTDKAQEISIDENKLYQLVNLEQGGQHRLRIEFPTGGVDLYAFTFG